VLLYIRGGCIRHADSSVTNRFNDAGASNLGKGCIPLSEAIGVMVQGLPSKSNIHADMAHCAAAFMLLVARILLPSRLPDWRPASPCKKVHHPH
jgi:hypothetical protein